MPTKAVAVLSTAQIRAAVGGDRAAVTALVQAFLPRVYGLCLRILKQPGLAEDATQETFVKVLRSLPKLQNPERIKSWTLTIAANCARDQLRKRSRDPQALVVELTGYEPSKIEAQGDGRARKRKAIDHAVARLKVEDRELFLLHTVEGVRLRELAETRGASEPALKSKLHRIRAKVRASARSYLNQHGGFDR